LQALWEWGEFKWNKTPKQDDPQYLDYLGTLADPYERLTRFARQCKNETYQVWAGDRLAGIGRGYEDKSKPVQAYQVYQKGLPKISDITAVHVHVLNARNMLLTDSRFEKALEAFKDKPSTADLIEAAEHCRKLVDQEPLPNWVDKSDVGTAYMAAAFCYYKGKNIEKTKEYLQKALTYPLKVDRKPLEDFLKKL
jgi:tetratricopeptide (TPR) repeat protein